MFQFTFLKNLFVIAWKVPGIVGIIRTIIDIVGADSVQEIFQRVRDAVQSAQIEKPLTDEEPAKRLRIFRYLKDRIGQRLLGISDNHFADVQQFRNEMSRRDEMSQTA
jgi:signal transduction histidine kinase